MLSESFPAIYTICCSNLPSTAVCCMCCTHIGRVVANNTCIVLQCVAVMCRVLQSYSVSRFQQCMQCIAVLYSVLQCVAVSCCVVQCYTQIQRVFSGKYVYLCFHHTALSGTAQAQATNYLSCAFTNPPLSSIVLFSLPASCCVPSHPLAHTAATSMQHTATSSTEWAHAELMRTSAKMETYGNTPHHTTLHHMAPHGTTLHHTAPTSEERAHAALRHHPRHPHPHCTTRHHTVQNRIKCRTSACHISKPSQYLIITYFITISPYQELHPDEYHELHPNIPISQTPSQHLNITNCIRMILTSVISIYKLDQQTQTRASVSKFVSRTRTTTEPIRKSIKPFSSTTN